MLARFLRLFLLFELFAYFFAGMLLHRLAGWSVAGVCVLMLLLALAWRIWVIAATYFIAALHRSQLPPEWRIPVVRQLLEAWREVLSLCALLPIEAFDWFFLKPDAPAKPGQIPLLLIHGYCCNRGFWWWLKPRLEAHGCSVATLTLEPLHGDIDGYSEQVARRINTLCRESGVSQVMLVGYSMGGLVARAYLSRYGGMRVAKLITLATPHQGNELAGLGLGRNARQMEPESAWLKNLAQLPLQAPCIAIYSAHDNYVVPVRNGMLAGAENRPLKGVGHLAMSVSSAVLKMLLAETVNHSAIMAAPGK